MIEKIKKKVLIGDLLIIGLILLLTGVAGWPFLRPGFFSSHDGLVHLINLVEFDRMIQAGQFPVRWAADLDLGFGNPLFNFYSPLLYYLSWIFVVFFGYLLSLKLSLFLAIFISGLFTFLLVKDIWGRWGGLIAAVAYLFSPYHFLDLFVRGAYPEFLAIALLPLVLWSFRHLLKGEKKLFFLLSSFSLAAVMLAHNYISFIFLPVLVLFVGMMILSNETSPPMEGRSFLGGSVSFLPHSSPAHGRAGYSEARNKVVPRRAVKVLAALVLGVGFSAFFFVPVFLERKYLLTISQMNIFQPQMHFLTLSGLWDCQWTYGVTAGSGMCFQLGKINLLLGLAPLLLLGQMEQKQRLFLLFFFFVTIGSLLLTLPVSSFLWQNIAFLAYGQFPWRFLSLVSLGLALISGASVMFFKQESGQRLFAGVAVAALILFNFGFSKPQSFNDLSDENFKKKEVLENVFVGRPEEKGVLYFRETVPVWVKVVPTKVSARKIEVENGEISNERILPTFYSFSLASSQEAKVKVNTFYFPGWEVLVDGEKRETTVGEDGTINFSTLPGEHQVEVVFTKTWPRKIGEITSLFSFLLILGLGILL